MIIAAVSDVHSPIYYEDFVRALEDMQTKPDLFLIAGDMVERGSLGQEVKEYKKVYNALFGKVSCPIIACFGNTEFPEYREKIKQEIKEIRFLDDQAMQISVDGQTVDIFGTTGALDEPTRWQKLNIPNINKIYQSRYQLADMHFKRYLGYKILLMHYAPTYKTLEGENPRFYANLGSRIWENIIVQRKLNLVVHGHSHHGSKFAWINSTAVFNVAFPVNKKIVIIDTDKLKPGLARFV